jgi:hypothetical protein
VDRVRLSDVVGLTVTWVAVESGSVRVQEVGAVRCMPHAEAFVSELETVQKP